MIRSLWVAREPLCQQPLGCAALDCLQPQSCGGLLTGQCISQICGGGRADALDPFCNSACALVSRSCEQLYTRRVYSPALSVGARSSGLPVTHWPAHSALSTAALRDSQFPASRAAAIQNQG